MRLALFMFLYGSHNKQQLSVLYYFLINGRATDGNCLPKVWGCESNISFAQ